MDKATKFVLIPFRDFRLLTCKRKINSKGRISGIVKEIEFSDGENDVEIAKKTQRFVYNSIESIQLFSRTTQKRSSSNKSSGKKPVAKKRRKVATDDESTQTNPTTPSDPEESENQTEPSDDSNESEETE